MIDRRFAAVAVVCMVVFGGLPLGSTPSVAASSGLDSDGSLTAWGGKTTAFTASLFDRSGDWEGSDGVMTHGEGLPGWFVKYDSDDENAFANLQTWVDSSSDRRILDHDVEDNRVLLAAPPEHIRRASAWGTVDGLLTRSWVEWIEVEQSVRVVEPVDLEDESTVSTKYEPTRRAKALAALNGGSFANDEDGAKGVAYDDDVSKTDMGDVKSAIGADELPSSANGSGVTIAVLDTGANVGEGSDRGLVFGNGSSGSAPRVEHGKNFLTNESINTSKTPENRTFDAIADGSGHGTYVAARAAGAGGGSEALRAPAHKSEIAVGKVLGDGGSGSIQNIVDGLEWAASDEVDADVVTMSLGTFRYSKVLENEIQDSLEEGGVSAVTVAAGNSRWTTGRTNLGSPSDADGVIAVAATTTNNSSTAEIAYFGNVGPDDGVKDGSGAHTRGELPDVGSPGMKTTVLTVSSNGAARNKTLSGTSMSTPDVASTAAVLVDYNPSLRGDHEAVRDRIVKGASPAPNIGYTEIGNGLLNVSNALDDERPGSTQKEVRTEQAVARDQANQALAGRIAVWLKSQGVPL